jgi:hypothetical protein
MTQTLRHPETQALRRAARRFTRALVSEAMLRATARIEAVVHAAEAEPVFLFEAALRSAWPGGAPEAPQREVVWATDQGRQDTLLHLQAFDGAGRLLLRRTYGTRVGSEVLA